MAIVDPGAASVGRLGAELAWVAGPLKVESEILGLWSPGGDGLAVYDVYADVFVVLTGETSALGKPVTPNRVFDPLHGGWGAWQLGARYEHVEVPRGDVAGSRAVDAVAVSMSGHFRREIRMPIVYQRTWQHRPTAGTADQAPEDFFGARLAMNW